MISKLCASSGRHPFTLRTAGLVLWYRHIQPHEYPPYQPKPSCSLCCEGCYPVSCCLAAAGDHTMASTVDFVWLERIASILQDKKVVQKDFSGKQCNTSLHILWRTGGGAACTKYCLNLAVAHSKLIAPLKSSLAKLAHKYGWIVDEVPTTLLSGQIIALVEGTKLAAPGWEYCVLWLTDQ